MANAKRQAAAHSFDEEEGEDSGSSCNHQYPVGDDDENTWRADVVEGATEYLGRHPTMCLDRAVRRSCSR